MKRSTSSRLAAGLLAAAGLGAGAAIAPAAASAATHPSTVTAPSGLSNAVFVQTNDTTGNQILAYSRAANGTLAFVHAYSTGGLGVALGGAVADKLASQDGLAYDAAGSLLIAVNGGSNTITTYQVNGDRLSGRRILPAGELPVSVATNGDLAEVLDAGGTGGVTSFRLSGGELHATGQSRALGLNPTATPQFLNTPGEIGFTPNGRDVVVTTKANGSDIDVFPVSHGELAATPVVNASATPVPFGFVFDPDGRLVVTEAADSNLSSYAINSNGTLTADTQVPDGEKALCWVAEVGGYFYGANAGSGTLSLYTENALGQLELSSANGGVAATTDAGPIDLAGSADGNFVYAQTGVAGTIDEYAVGTGGALTEIGSITGLSATGMEGIVAS